MGNSLVALSSSSKKFSARAALVDLQEPSRALLSECFRQFGIESISMTSDKADRLVSEKFEACVIRVGNHAAPVLQSARQSRSNSRMIIYGLGGSLKEAMKLSQFGINAVFNEPLERPAALSQGDMIEASQILSGTEKSEVIGSRSGRAATTAPQSAPVTLEQLEREHILRILKESDGNRERAAAILGISSRTLYRKLREYETHTQSADLATEA